MTRKQGFQQLHPVAQAALAGCFTWGVTLLGAALVFFACSVNQTLLDIMLGFAAGVMIAASFWSLLAPSIEMAAAQGMPSWVPPAVGFLLGGVFLRLGDALLPHLHPGKERSQAEGGEPLGNGRPCWCWLSLFTMFPRGSQSV